MNLYLFISFMMIAFLVGPRLSDKTPPAFIVHAQNDPCVPVQNSLLFYKALTEKHVEASLFIPPQGEHSIALRDNPGIANEWTILCEKWLRERGIIQ